jgi:ureidoacrylate peracid hydrolase
MQVTSLEQPARCAALLVIDMQNDTVHPDGAGAYASTGAAARAAAQGVIANVATLVLAAQAAGVPVFFSRIVGYPLDGLSGDNALIFTTARARRIQSRLLECPDRGRARPSNRRCRTGSDAYERVQRDRRRQHAPQPCIRTLVVDGAWKNMAVEHTVRDAADHGYEVTLVEDATSSLSSEWQNAAVSYALTNIATVSDTATVITTLRE